MAMTAMQKRVFRQALASKKYADILIAIIDGGSATALSQKTEQVLAIALADGPTATNVIAAFEGGSALSAGAIRRLRKIIGRKSIADAIVTQINAIT